MSIVDEYTLPVSVRDMKPFQNMNQYGFSEGITYMMGALQRHETEKFCIDMKKTFFGCSLDGKFKQDNCIVLVLMASTGLPQNSHMKILFPKLK